MTALASVLDHAASTFTITAARPRSGLDVVSSLSALPDRRAQPKAVTAFPAAVVRDVAAVASVAQVLDNIRNWIIGILAGLATVFLTIGGARRVMSGGDPAEVERANAALRSAAFGYALAALAPLILQVLKSIVGA